MSSKANAPTCPGAAASSPKPPPKKKKPNRRNSDEQLLNPLEKDLEMAETLTELRARSDDDLVREHDRLARQTVVGTQHYLQELARREQHRQTDEMLRYTRMMLRYTRWVAIMTVVITIATVVNIVVLLV